VSRHVVITPVQPKGHAVRFYLCGDAELTRTGAAGWQINDRPRAGATTEWVDHGPFNLSIPLMLDGISEQPFDSPVSVEPDIARVKSWETRASGAMQPPVVKVTGPVDHGNHKWVVSSVDWMAALRHPTNGHRWQQELTLVLLQYVPPTVTLAKTSPAKAAQERQASGGSSTGSVRRYTVKSGDTLPSIAAKLLGSASDWPKIAQLNGIRDSRSLKAGQVLKIPA